MYRFQSMKMNATIMLKVLQYKKKTNEMLNNLLTRFAQSVDYILLLSLFNQNLFFCTYNQSIWPMYWCEYYVLHRDQGDKVKGNVAKYKEKHIDSRRLRMNVVRTGKNTLPTSQRNETFSRLSNLCCFFAFCLVVRRFLFFFLFHFTYTLFLKYTIHYYMYVIQLRLAATYQTFAHQILCFCSRATFQQSRICVNFRIEFNPPYLCSRPL